MIPILHDYSIHSNTMALFPAKHTDYDTIILETNKQFAVKQTALNIIKETCLRRFITYEGIKKAVFQQTGYQRKVPIPLNPHLNMYFFPTHATNHFDCSWISYSHVDRILKHQDPQKDNPSSTILFHNGQTLHLEVSTYILKKQMKRTSELINWYWEWYENNTAIQDLIEFPSAPFENIPFS